MKFAGLPFLWVARYQMVSAHASHPTNENLTNGMSNKESRRNTKRLQRSTIPDLVGILILNNVIPMSWRKTYIQILFSMLTVNKHYLEENISLECRWSFFESMLIPFFRSLKMLTKCWKIADKMRTKSCITWSAFCQQFQKRQHFVSNFKSISILSAISKASAFCQHFQNRT